MIKTDQDTRKDRKKIDREVKAFKEILRARNGRTLKWFHASFLNSHTLTYSGFTGQLNGLSPVSNSVLSAIRRYVKQEDL